jgi:hypothetical protein
MVDEPEHGAGICSAGIMAEVFLKGHMVRQEARDIQGPDKLSCFVFCQY